MTKDKQNSSKKTLPAIPDPKASAGSQKEKMIGNASDRNPQMIASALKKWLSEDK
ncbi:MAG: hypothetical protein IK139_08675 [Lachnospiraceae bacterium]|nr:hypothetical protein [Lachnospiraceae bacterium]